MWREKKRQILSVVLILVLLLAGCGGPSQPAAGEDNPGTGSGGTVASRGDDETNGEAGTVYYTLEEITLPDLEARMSAGLEEGDRLAIEDPILHGDSIYQDVLTSVEDGMWRVNPLQTLKLSDMEWRSTERLADIDGKTYSSKYIFYSEGDDIYSIAYCPEEEKYYLAVWDENGMRDILCPVPSEVANANYSYDARLAIDKAGNFYYFERGGSSVTFLDGNLQTVQKVNLSGSIIDILQADAESEVYWYGVNEDGKVTIRNVRNGEILLDNFEGVSAGRGVLAAYSDEGDLFLADTRYVWKIGEEPEQVLDFLAKDYTLNVLYGMEAGENGEILFLTKVDGDDTILRLRETDTPSVTEKEEIVIAFARDHLALNQIIARFNRQSDRYHVSVMLAGADETGLEFMDRMQLEISTGGGPDILGHDVIQDITPYMENGYLECLDGVLEDESQYLQAALEGCRLDGKLYGMPYDCSLEFVAYPEAAAGGRASWTMPELMEAVRASGARILQAGCNGMDIVRQYALYDNRNTDYIDWENGVSHLTEQPFLDLLAFAKEYEDTVWRKAEEGALTVSGEIFALGVTMTELSQMSYVYACFQGAPAILGYPRAEGIGVYVNARELYVNVNSDCKEGAKEFLRYLLSEEAQRKYIEYDSYAMVSGMMSVIGAGVSGYTAYFPIHMGVYADVLSRSFPKGLSERGGVEYETTALTEEQEELFYSLLEHAQPGIHNVTNISSIIDEELAPYFAGAVTAERAAQILDNRVQLYLDERGN